jgi:hypothetical protein
VSLCLASGVAFAAQTIDAQAPPPTVLPWVSDVVKMNDAGIAPDVIANYVKNTPAHSSLGADDIIYLRDHGISPPLITAMIEHGAVGQSVQTVPIAAPPPAPVYAQAPPPQDYQPPAAYDQQPLSQLRLPGPLLLFVLSGLVLSLRIRLRWPLRFSPWIWRALIWRWGIPWRRWIPWFRRRHGRSRRTPVNRKPNFLTLAETSSGGIVVFL